MVHVLCIYIYLWSCEQICPIFGTLILCGTHTIPISMSTYVPPTPFQILGSCVQICQYLAMTITLTLLSHSLSRPPKELSSTILELKGRCILYVDVTYNNVITHYWIKKAHFMYFPVGTVSSGLCLGLLRSGSGPWNEGGVGGRKYFRGG